MSHMSYGANQMSEMIANSKRALTYKATISEHAKMRDQQKIIAVVTQSHPTLPLPTFLKIKR